MKIKNIERIFILTYLEMKPKRFNVISSTNFILQIQKIFGTKSRDK